MIFYSRMNSFQLKILQLMRVNRISCLMIVFISVESLVISSILVKENRAKPPMKW